MLTELVELGRKRKEQMKATQNEIKQHIQGTNSEGKESRTQINDLEQKEEKNIELEQNEETRTQKMMRGLGASRTTSNIQYPNYRGVRRRRTKARN